MKIKDIQAMLDILQGYLTQPDITETDKQALFDIQRLVLNLDWRRTDAQQ